MRRLRFFPLIVCVSLAVPAAYGQQVDSAEPASAPASAEDDQSFVSGLSPDDLLKVREQPSPLGKTIGRLRNGSIVRTFECKLIEGYEWCKVEALDVAGISGWTPARYLQSLEELSAELAEATEADEASGDEPAAASYADVPIPQPAPRDGVIVDTTIETPPEEPADATKSASIADKPMSAEIAEEPDAAQSAVAPDVVVDESPAVVGTLGPAVSGPGPEADAEEVREARLPTDETVSALPPGLEARFAGAAPAPLSETTPSEPELALAPATPKVPETPEAEAALDKIAAVAPSVSEASDGGAPIPTPRPGSSAWAAQTPELLAPAAEQVAEPIEPEAEQAGAVLETEEPAPEPEQVALAVQTPATTAPDRPSLGEVGGEIPCARYVGQPMARCILMVARTGTDAADVTVVWPDGGTRLIEFRDGAPQGSNSREEFRFTREGTLNLIRIGGSERFEILDALAFEN